MKLIILITVITVMPLMTLMASEASEREKEEVTDDHRFLYAAFAHSIAALLLCGSRIISCTETRHCCSKQV
jgi:hypothetical protein